MSVRSDIASISLKFTGAGERLVEVRGCGKRQSASSASMRRPATWQLLPHSVVPFFSLGSALSRLLCTKGTDNKEGVYLTWPGIINVYPEILNPINPVRSEIYVINGEEIPGPGSPSMYRALLAYIYSVACNLFEIF